MSEFTLPQIRRSAKASTGPLPQPAARVKSFRIYRWTRRKRNPTMDTFDIDRDHCGRWSSMPWVKINDQSTRPLSFRRSCREGVCGSCAMISTGSTHWPV